MALDDISFINNIGTIRFTRALMDISDEWQWNGRVSVHRKRITVDAKVARGEAMDGVITTHVRGQWGTLKLPWTTLTNIKMESLEMPPGDWADFAPVQASFIDDMPVNNRYTMSFFGLKLLHPRLTLPIPTKTTTDQYAQVPKEDHGDVAVGNPYYGPIRYRTGYTLMQMSLSGIMALPEGMLPTDVVAILQQRIGVGGVEGSLPNGYPRTFRLADAIPEVEGELALEECFVAGGRITWEVEQQTAKISVTLMAQPQAWAEE